MYFFYHYFLLGKLVDLLPVRERNLIVRVPIFKDSHLYKYTLIIKKNLYKGLRILQSWASCFSGSANSNDKEKVHMTETSTIAIILSLIAVGGTLVGTWLGRLLERSNEKQKWRRECCLEAYTDVLSSCAIVAFEVDHVYGIECGSSAHVKQMGVILEKVAEMYRARDKALLLGFGEAINKLHDLTFYCGKEMAEKSVKCPKISESDWNKIRIIDYTILLAEFQNAARHDLDVFPKPKRKQIFSYRTK